MNWQRSGRAGIAAFFTGALLAACGDGGSTVGAADPPPPPPPPAAPQITAAPAAVTAADGAPATFTVTASGSDLRYQWQKNGGDVAGATQASFTLPAVTLADDGAAFRAVVSNAGGSVASAEARLTVTPVAPAITTAPAAASAVVGGAATFTATVSGSAPLTRQWQRDGAPIAGATDASYTTPPLALADSGATFALRVENAAGAVTSAAATLTVIERPTPPSITAEPQDASVTEGATATFTVAASGLPSLQYQWRRDGAPIAGATAASYTTPPVAAADAGARFSVVVGNGFDSVTSRDAVLAVTRAPLVSGRARITLGTLHNVAVRADGRVIAWGFDNVGQLGDGPLIPGTTDAREVATTAVAVAAGAFESLALGADGVIRGWGRKFGNTSILGGPALSAGTAVPSPATGGWPTGFTHLVTGTANAFAFARRSDGTVWLMPGTATAASFGFDMAARAIEGLGEIAALCAGVSGDAVAIGADGRVWQLSAGAAPGGGWVGRAALVAGVADAVAAQCNGFSCIALTRSGAVLNWGPFAPVVVNGLPPIVQITSTGSGLLALDGDGRVWRWNTGGTPVRVEGIDQVLEIAGGLTSVLARRADGSVWTLGTVPAPVPGIDLN
jgi:hypothetical protein